MVETKRGRHDERAAPYLCPTSHVHSPPNINLYHSRGLSRSAPIPPQTSTFTTREASPDRYQFLKPTITTASNPFVQHCIADPGSIVGIKLQRSVAMDRVLFPSDHSQSPQNSFDSYDDMMQSEPASDTERAIPPSSMDFSTNDMRRTVKSTNLIIEKSNGRRRKIVLLQARVQQLELKNKKLRTENEVSETNHKAMPFAQHLSTLEPTVALSSKTGALRDVSSYQKQLLTAMFN